ncbi:putative Lectin-like receptor kinase [Melia azedarach]|uniref:Lectin-like receptor kinase n=1 Tax=Melia azedarach TaxID=155640 RepID=A0ACC1XPT2_MELAZ|nr:putative Lectin-like receptor kinase [Melia azedarach]
MESHLCYRWLLVSSITYFLLLNQLLAHSLFHVHHHPGIPTNVTKNLHFPSFISSSSSSTIHEIKLLGSAAFSSGKGSIQIPDPSPAVDHAYKAGRAIYSSPIRIFDPLTSTPASFQTTFSFQFENINNSFPGNGLAFVIVSDEFTVGRPGPWLGILNDACEHYKVFAVEFDNRHDPKFGDPNDDHIGINLGSVVSFKTADSSKTNASLHDYDLIHRAWILYDGHRKWIDIYLGVDGNPVPSLPILSTSLNLSPFLKEYMFVGFSASTGDSPQIHNIFSWEFSSTSQAILNVPSRHVCHRNIAHQVSKYSTTNGTSTPSSFMIFMCVMGLCTVAVLNLYCSSKRRKTESSVAFGFPDKKQRPVLPSKPRRFETLVLYRATKRFSKMEVLASDSRGVLYRGMLPNGCYVAVKRFSIESLNLSRLDWSRVLKRISTITHVCHPSLASIRGWCCDNRERIIVYDYFQNGSLHGWLFGLGSLPWTRRFKIIKDTAEALSFLHSKELTHGNLKTTSIFLDSNYKAVLGDYGFIFFQGDVMDSVPRKELDVFEFGMLMLEIISGKKTIETEEQEMGVLDFAWDMHERGEKVKVIDERMGSNVNIEQAIRVLEIGLACTLNENNNGRPSMEQVLLQLLNMQKLLPRLPPNRQAHLLSKNSATSQLLIGNMKGSH